MNFIKEISFADLDYCADALRELLDSFKVVVLRGYERAEELSDFFQRLSDELGEIIHVGEDLENGRATGERWIDITYDPAFPERYRSASVAQPMHTDFSYVEIGDNLQFFYCEAQAKFGGATTFLDSRFLVDLLVAAGETPLLHELQLRNVTFSKANSRKALPILRADGDDYRLNWNYHCLDAQSDGETVALCERFHQFLQSRVVASGVATQVILHRNDAVFFHDERLLHGRNAFFATAKGERRLVKGSLVLHDVGGKRADDTGAEFVPTGEV